MLRPDVAIPKLKLPESIRKAKKVAARESSIKNGCMNIARDFFKKGAPVKAVKMPGSRYGEKNTPDIHLSIAGHSCWVELKRPGEEPTPGQYKKLDDWEKIGCTVAWMDSRKAFHVFITKVLRKMGWMEHPNLGWVKSSV